MNCPYCNEHVPDSNYICPHCGKAMQPDKDPTDYVKKTIKPPRLTANLVIVLIILVLLGILVYAAFIKGKAGDGGTKAPVNTEVTQPAESEAAPVGKVINAENPGQEIAIEKLIQEGKTTIFDFYSESCPPCRRISPLLEDLDRRRADIVVYKVDINRPGVEGIDWTSPLARQFSLGSIPHFKIYDAAGKLVFEDRPAYMEVERLLRSEGLIK